MDRGWDCCFNSLGGRDKCDFYGKKKERDKVRSADECHKKTN
jgi:hypothetical protein